MISLAASEARSSTNPGERDDLAKTLRIRFANELRLPSSADKIGDRSDDVHEAEGRNQSSESHHAAFQATYQQSQNCNYNLCDVGISLRAHIC